MQRDRLGSRLGFILLSAGCAIGLGNVWRFPYIVGANGGGAFVLFYLLFLVAFGLPIMTMEFSLGRAAQKSPVKLYQALEKPGQKWHYHGTYSMICNYLLMMFYTVITGWILRYFIMYAFGNASTLSPEQIPGEFGGMVSNPTLLIIFTFVVVLIGFFVCSFKLQSGIERVTKYIMLALLGILVALAIYSLTLDGASEGLKFYLKPDFSKITPSVVVAAMNQSFFTLSLGIGSMAIFGSYLGKDRALMGESLNVIILDTFVAVTTGLVIFPACATYNVAPDQGPALIFQSLPNVFNSMPAGRIWGTLFFLFFSFAAFSTVFAVFENIIACSMEVFGWSRKKACLINCIAFFALVLPCIFGFNVLSNFHPFGGSTDISDLEDFFVSYVGLPLGSLCYVLFCTSKKGWGWKNFMAEANTGKGLKVKNWLFGYVKYVVPVVILAIFVIGVLTRFGIIE